MNTQIEFDRSVFYNKNSNIDLLSLEFNLKDIILDKKINFNFEIDDISSLNYQRKFSLIFLENEISLSIDLKKICIITNKKEIFLNDKYHNIIFVKDINLAYKEIINKIYIHDDLKTYDDEFLLKNNSFISKFADIADTALIANNCVIGKGVKIGKNCIIKNNVVIKNSIISNDVIISDNTVIGSSGFGFDLKNMGSKNLLPQIGIVYIDENTYIGSCCTIDRAKIDITYIGKNSMIDNLVHIAHNVVVGNFACIAAQSGISGSVKIGNHLISGGQSGFAGHITIGDNVTVAAKSGVTKNIKSNSIVAGFPAIDIKDWKKLKIKEKKNGYK